MGSLENNYFSIGFNDFRYLLKYDKMMNCLITELHQNHSRL